MKKHRQELRTTADVGTLYRAGTWLMRGADIVGARTFCAVFTKEYTRRTSFDSSGSGTNEDFCKLYSQQVCYNLLESKYLIAFLSVVSVRKL